MGEKNEKRDEELEVEEMIEMMGGGGVREMGEGWGICTKR